MSSYHQKEPSLDISVVVPVYNERDNVGPLADDIVREVGKLNRPFEVILVNDGSKDGSTSALDGVASSHPQVKVIHFAENRGQTIAIAAGMYYSVGRVIVLMDGDRQNDPSDIGLLVARLEEGFECVSGWRKNRQDAGIRKLPSRVANWLVNRITGVPVHDLGCTLKAYTRNALDPTELFGEMHRFLAVMVQERGGRIDELVVKHHPRTAGDSKYGMGRIPRVVADMLLMRTLYKYRTRPSHMAAQIAQWLFVFALVFAFMCFVSAVRSGMLGFFVVWFLAAIILTVGSVVVLTTGLVCELVIRNRYALSGRHPWIIERMTGD